MSRIVSWFSCGAASAVATMLSNPDVVAYCDTGAEHQDNARFMADCEKWFGQKVTILKNPDYRDTWDVFEKRSFLSGIHGAPCTGELKIAPRLEFQRPDDIHVFGYTADGPDIKRAKALRENWPELLVVTPLIERGITKASCLAMIQSAGLKEPITYAMGFPNANCIPCVKATSPDYWSLVRKEFPEQFTRMVELSRRLNVRLTRINDERIFIDEIPADWPTTNPIAPECDFLCHLAEQDMAANLREAASC
jgi:3'-phosphoadenosine 5'-phosphosulfate sulfotransferase (PAPS reductase)/FAD synthetase